MVGKTAILFLCCTLFFSVPAFVPVGSAADVETVGNLKVSGVIDNTGGEGIRFPDGFTQTSACNACVNGVLSISLGGTGGATADAARENLGVPGLATRNTFTGGQTIQGYLTTTGDLNLPATGLITAGGNRLIHAYGLNNFFAGSNAGNLAMTGNGNTASGKSALLFNTDGSRNTANGSFALIANTTGSSNTANGAAALSSNTTASGNTAVGDKALEQQAYSNNGTAWDTFNTAVGYQALNTNDPTSTSNGYLNTALGSYALTSNTTGFRNTASGYGALSSNTTGNDNTVSGISSLQNNATGAFNTASGNQSLYYNTEGNNNSAFGLRALFNATGSSNTAIGYNAGSGLKIGDNNIYIGNNVQTSTINESNIIKIGQGIESVFISGIYGHSATSGSAVYVTSNGQLGTVNSSRRYKEEIRDMGDATNGLMKLRPVTFYYKKEYADGPRLLQYGLIAEEVAEVYPGLVQYNEKGEPNTVYYQFVNAMLLNEVQKQQRWIEAHEELINLQGEMIKELKAEIGELKRFAGI